MISMKPHHLLDIIKDYGNKTQPETHPFGASLKEVSDSITQNPEQELIFVVGVDTICETCNKLKKGKCTTVLGENELMEDYNHDLDSIIFKYLNMQDGEKLSALSFMKKIKEKTPGFEKLFSRGDKIERIKGTEKTFEKFNIK